MVLANEWPLRCAKFDSLAFHSHHDSKERRACRRLPLLGNLPQSAIGERGSWH